MKRTRHGREDEALSDDALEPPQQRGAQDAALRRDQRQRHPADQREWPHVERRHRGGEKRRSAQRESQASRDRMQERSGVHHVCLVASSHTKKTEPSTIVSCVNRFEGASRDWPCIVRPHTQTAPRNVFVVVPWTNRPFVPIPLIREIRSGGNPWLIG